MSVSLQREPQRFLLTVGNHVLRPTHDELLDLKRKIDLMVRSSSSDLVQIVKEKIAAFFDVGIPALESEGRGVERVANARMAAMWLLIEFHLSDEHAGAAFKRERSTATYAHTTIKDRMALSEKFAAEIKLIQEAVARDWDATRADATKS